MTDHKARACPVYLVGAGPGDPGLISLKGRDVLRQADRVFCHPQISPALMRHLNPGAEWIPAEVGSMSTVEEMVQAVVDGERVVRLVPGDAFLSSSAVEEAKQLAARGAGVEPVPGVPRELAVPVYAGIAPGPEWTVRRYGETEEPDWEVFASSPGTGILHVDRRRLTEAARRLIGAGVRRDMTAAWVEAGTCVEQRVWTGTLEQVPKASQGAEEGWLILGEAVQNRSFLAGFEHKPLFGRRVLITRARGQSASMVRKVRELGGEAVEFPAIEIRPPRNRAPLDAALKQLDRYDWVVFTSVNGVKYFFRHLKRLKLDVRRMHRARLAAIGPRTAEELEKRGLRVEVQPEEYRAEALAESLRSLVAPGDRVLLPRADIARKLLAVELERIGCEVTDVDAYDTVPGTRGVREVVELLKKGELHILTFTSSSTVRNFVEALRRVEDHWKPLLRQVQVACIGPITADTAKESGLRVDIVAREYTMDGLIEALIRLPRMESGRGRKEDGT
ncbi:uroporphyrinogen III methyltransferase/synthase [Melghirimyces profundicolus]|uniref:Uroporphyrinogen-III synthase n=1 Tax=Melghirimyces profundicolus TaxID=1242148 RepID=A0A2T6BTI5_9BACL|nr:uroporphyrinogen-III synthase [Melghirimyces profundicolus]PTX59373.1 uroporphyrinogen III methyltransferase/synthase [Melghirimyces profundicolus]